MSRTMLDEIRAVHPEGADALARMRDAAVAVDPELLELCRLRVAAMLRVEPGEPGPARGHGPDPERAAALADWSRASCFTDRERAHLAFCEQFVLSVGDVRDEDVAALRAHGDDLAVHEFVSALYVVELHERLAATWARRTPTGAGR